MNINDLLITILLTVAFFSPILKNNFLLYLIALELFVLSINLNFVFQGIHTNDAKGVYVCLLLLAVAAADTLIGLSLLINYFRGSLQGDIKLSTLSRNLIIGQIFFFTTFLDTAKTIPILVPAFARVEFDNLIYESQIQEKIQEIYKQLLFEYSTSYAVQMKYAVFFDFWMDSKIFISGTLFGSIMTLVLLFFALKIHEYRDQLQRERDYNRMCWSLGIYYVDNGYLVTFRWYFNWLSFPDTHYWYGYVLDTNKIYYGPKCPKAGTFRICQRER